jgi:hypothetical protein
VIPSAGSGSGDTSSGVEDSSDPDRIFRFILDIHERKNIHNPATPLAMAARM